MQGDYSVASPLLIFIIAIVVIIIELALYDRRLERTRMKTETQTTLRVDTSGDRILRSKVIDNTCFDGESDDYTEAHSRLRQQGRV